MCCESSDYCDVCANTHYTEIVCVSERRRRFGNRMKAKSYGEQCTWWWLNRKQPTPELPERPVLGKVYSRWDNLNHRETIPQHVNSGWKNPIRAGSQYHGPIFEPSCTQHDDPRSLEWSRSPTSGFDPQDLSRRATACPPPSGLSLIHI